MLMAVEIRVIPAVGAFTQISGTVLAFCWMLILSPAKQVLDFKCEAFGIGYSGSRADSMDNNREHRKARFLTAVIRRNPVAANRPCQMSKYP